MLFLTVALRQLEGKVTIVTGGACGIGYSSAKLFAENGAKVVIADINEAAGKGAARQISKKGFDAVFVRTDVSKSADVKKCVDISVRTHGRLDCLFSNAGFNPVGTVTETSEEMWDRVLNTNLKGMFLMCKYAIPEMKKTGKGSIVCTSSVNGLQAIPNQAAYIASKGGIISLVRAMALDHAEDNIRVNCICPGAVRTQLMERVMKANRIPESKIYKNAMRRVGEPSEIATVAMFLLSDAPSFMTGAIVCVDGGDTAVKVF